MSNLETFERYEDAVSYAEAFAHDGYKVEIVIYETETWPWREVNTRFDVRTVGLGSSIEEIDNR